MLGILDIGSTTVHLLALDPRPHARPTPVAQERRVVPLMQHLDEQGAITQQGVDLMLRAARELHDLAPDLGITELHTMATSALRETPNGTELLAGIDTMTGVETRVLTGTEEAEFTFIAARRWAGWGAGRLLVLDIGGSSLQLAQGASGLPEQCFSLPLGAGRLTHQFIAHDPALESERVTLGEQVRSTLAHVVPTLLAHRPDRVVGTSKMLRSLGRLAGFPSAHGGRVLHRDALADWTERLGRMDRQHRLELPGMTPERAVHVLAGAMVAREVMEQLHVEQLETCPWALREGLLLQFIDGNTPAVD